ncbi:hypothetical protein BgiBS90_030505 [Biomphalaria glabrata]|nr:hypothetical protein BgiBS90_030505 [Biomphalaria glabrata]
MYDSIREEMKMIVNMIRNKVDENLLKMEGQKDQSDQMVSQAKDKIDTLMKEQLPGQDCGCTNSGDRGAGVCSTICDSVVGKSCGCDFKDVKRGKDCCNDLNGMYQIQRKETNEEA